MQFDILIHNILGYCFVCCPDTLGEKETTEVLVRNIDVCMEFLLQIKKK